MSELVGGWVYGLMSIQSERVSELVSERESKSFFLFL